MKSAKEMDPSRSIDSRRRSATEATRARIIVSAVRSRLRRSGALAVALGFLMLASCASPRKDSLPTYQDYSDGTSVFADRFLADWKSGEVDASLIAPSVGWRGPLPGEGLAAVPARAPLSLAGYVSRSAGLAP